MTTTMTGRRAAFRAGTVVQLHPDTNAGAGSHDLNDRGVVIGCRPMDDMKHLDVVDVCWDSRMRNLTPEEEDYPLSHWATPHASTRLRSVRVNG